MSNIGQRIKERRIKVGLTADKLAEKLKKSRATIYRYESSDADNMPISILAPLAKELGTTPAELMGWAGPPPKVTTHLTFGSDSPEHDLYQYYIRRPEAVQKEIIKRLKDMDVTFSKNVCKLLQDSGGVDEFMKYTGIQFAIVGKLMQGEPTEVSPDEAEKVAAFFKTDVVDLFFNSSVKKSDDGDRTPQKGKEKSGIDSIWSRERHPEDFSREDTSVGESLRPYFKVIFEKNYSIDGKEEKCYELCKHRGLNLFIRNVWFDIEHHNQLDSGDIYRAYEVIAELIAKDPDIFMERYVNHMDKEFAKHQLEQYIKKHFRKL